MASKTVLRKEACAICPPRGIASGGPAHALILDSGILFAGRSEVVVTHGADKYRLRLTRQNRLILTK
ncbi:MAG: hemin uptake protein HemP [Gammaproteobacteria bacterium]|nr:hemin uptake protein HemP [Gammaproteobacteria bacterium]MBU1482231.1 hemin uptake protein HemP [Gammaproteobacteria bacterium]